MVLTVFSNNDSNNNNNNSSSSRTLCTLLPLWFNASVLFFFFINILRRTVGFGFGFCLCESHEKRHFFSHFFPHKKNKLLFLFFFTEFLGIFPEFGLIPRQKWRAAVRTNGEQIFFYWISIKVCFRSPFSFASVLAKFFLIFFVFFLLLGRRNVFGWPHQKLPSFSVFFLSKCHWI